MFSRLTGFALGMFLVLVSVHPSAQDSVLRDEMLAKLSNTQQLLEAVIKGDFPAMTRSAEALGRISETEIGAWQSASLATPEAEYTKQGTLFALAVQGMRDAAANQNIDQALHEYTALISSCTRCHAHVRSPRVASLRVPGLAPLVTHNRRTDGPASR